MIRRSAAAAVPLPRPVRAALWCGVCALCSSAFSAEPKPEVRSEYEMLVRQADLASHPERHAQIAAWCRTKKWEEQAAVHEEGAKRHQYAKEKAKLKAEPKASDWKRLLQTAQKFGLGAETAEAQRAWADADLRERRAKVKDDDLAGLKKLLDAVAKQGRFPEGEKLAKDIVAKEPANGPAHLYLGHLQDGEAWSDPWELLVQKGGLKDVKARVEIYQKLEALRKAPAKAYAKNPLGGVPKFTIPDLGVTVHKDRIRGLGDGQGTQFLWAPPDYDPGKAWPLIVELHGGGMEESKDAVNGNNNGKTEWHASMIIAGYPMRYADKAKFVVVAPWARLHITNSWNIRVNMLDVVDAILDACERFNIDRKRIYLTGASMGGGGTVRMAWVVPELFPAYAARAGFYWKLHPVPDLTGRSMLFFYGKQDMAHRISSMKEVAEMSRKGGADVEEVGLDSGHILPEDPVFMRMFDYFGKHTNPVTPDLELVRRFIDETVKEKEERMTERKTK